MSETERSAVAAGPAPRAPVIFNWGVASSFGWGIIGLHLALNWAEDAALLPICASYIDRAGIAMDALRGRVLEPVLANARTFGDWLAAYRDQTVSVSCPVLYGLGNDLVAARAAHNVELRGGPDIALFFIEDTALDAAARERAKRFAVMVAGSRWNQLLLASAALGPPVELALQGIDRTLFHPGPRSNWFKDRFVIFSGGKLEYRKGQDLALLAFRAFRARHPEALLVTAWHSPWSGLAQQLAVNPLVAPVPLRDGRIDVTGWATANGIPAEAVIDLGAVPNFQMPPILRECDVALFPNRAEGGTNLVAMECMACGVPAIVSANTGHLDLIAGEACVALTRQGAVAATPFYRGTEGWGESDVEEIVEALETLWRQRQRRARIGRAGAALMADWGWPDQMARLKETLLPYLGVGGAVTATAGTIVLEPYVPERDPGAAATLFQSGVALQHQGEIDAAIAAYRAGIAIHPGLPEAYVNLGAALAKQGRGDNAIAAYRQAITLRPDFAAAQTNLGVALAKQGKLADAADAHRRAIAATPDFAEAHANLGAALGAQGLIAEAIVALRRALELRPEYPTARINLAKALRRQDAASDQPAYVGFYINLERSPARRAEMEAEFARFGVERNYTRFAAADGNTLGFPNPRMPDSAIGCFTSHYLLLKANVGSRLHLHVLEDDAVFSRFTAATVRHAIASGVIDNFDLLFTDCLIAPDAAEFGRYHDLLANSVERDAGGNVASIRLGVIGYTACASSYIVNAGSIAKLADIFAGELAKGTAVNVDLVMRNKARDGAIRAGCLFPFVTSFRLDRLFDDNMERGYDQRSGLALSIARQSFFVGCDMAALRDLAARSLPVPESMTPMPDQDLHAQVLGRILSFVRSPLYRPF